MEDQEPIVDVGALRRIKPLSYDDMTVDIDEETCAAWRKRGSGDPRSNVITGTFMWNPELSEVRSPFVSYVKTSTCLPLRERELAILRTAWRCGADFMWHMHTEIGLECGLTQEEVERVGAGPGHAAWTALEAAVIRSMDELHDFARIADATWAVLAGTFDNKQLIELVTLAGSYHVMAYTMGAIGIRPPSPTGESPNLPGNRFLFPKADPA